MVPLELMPAKNCMTKQQHSPPHTIRLLLRAAAACCRRGVLRTAPATAVKFVAVKITVYVVLSANVKHELDMLNMISLM